MTGEEANSVRDKSSKKSVQFSEVLDDADLAPGYSTFNIRDRNGPRIPISMELKRRIESIMSSTAYVCFAGLLLVISLFFADAWVLGNPPNSDDGILSGILLFVFIFFCLEITLNVCIDRPYLFGFYFWMDLFGTFSIVLDIPLIANEFVPYGSANQGSIIRSIRVIRLVSRFGRIFLLLRSLRLCLRHNPCLADKAELFEPSLKAIRKVATKVSSQLSIQTAVLVLILAIVIPFLNYNSVDKSPTAWTTYFQLVAENQTSTWHDLTSLGQSCFEYYEDTNTPLVSIYVESPWFPQPYSSYFHQDETLRRENIGNTEASYAVYNSTLVASGNPNADQYLSANGIADFNIKLELNITKPNSLDAMFNILIIILIIVLMLYFSALADSTVGILVVRPLEKMTKTLRSSAATILEGMKTVKHANSFNADKIAQIMKCSEDAEHTDSDSEDSLSGDINAEVIQSMAKKLARIVKHSFNSQAKEIIDRDDGIDESTAEWLKQSYTDKGSAAESPRSFKRTTIRNIKDLHQLTMAKAVQADDLSNWAFDVLKYSNEDLSGVIFYIFSLTNFLEEFKIPGNTFEKFLSELSSLYLDNIYHNYKHGCDICITTYLLIQESQLSATLSSLEVFSLLVAAIAHDVGHLGVNNLFLQKSGHDLTYTYNDRSPLENMHCEKLYSLIRKADTNIFVGLEKKQLQSARKLILTVILGTDMSQHFEQVSKAQIFLEVNGKDTKEFCRGDKNEIDCFKEEKNRLFIMELVLHCADISNPLKPFNVSLVWSDLVIEEFCRQGDQEVELGLEISPMCDRGQIHVCNMQMGFIEFVVAPLILAFVDILPTLHELGDKTLKNFLLWGDKRRAELEAEAGANTPEEIRKLDDRLSKFKDKLSHTVSLRHEPQRARSRLNSGGVHDGNEFNDRK